MLHETLRNKYEMVIGLEVHCQMKTRTKLFCSCPNNFGDAPNTNVCPVCLGLPGALPVISREAVTLAVRAALATGCTVHETSIFSRKNYFYPDLPKGYQISQYDRPYATDGKVEALEADGTSKTVRLERIHMEEDAGKLLHEGYPWSKDMSGVDLNRSGTPLIEIVSKPDIRSAQEAHAYLTALKAILVYADVSDCNMEKGSLRCDANVSVRVRGTEPFGTRAEIKNLNSFRNVSRAIEYEYERQVALVEAGHKVVQETRLYRADKDETASMRSKEDAHDYRYFPEPDLPPLGRELDRIAQQVDQHLLDAPLVAHHGTDARIHLHMEGELLFFRQWPDDGGHLLNGAGHIERFARHPQLACLDFGDIQHVIDQRQQVARAVPDHAHLLGLLEIERPRQPLQQDTGEADDGVERRAQFMAHGGQKG